MSDLNSAWLLTILNSISWAFTVLDVPSGDIKPKYKIKHLGFFTLRFLLPCLSRSQSLFTLALRFVALLGSWSLAGFSQFIPTPFTLPVAAPE